LPVNSEVLVDLKNIENPEITIFLMEALLSFVYRFRRIFEDDEGIHRFTDNSK